MADDTAAPEVKPTVLFITQLYPGILFGDALEGDADAVHPVRWCSTARCRFAEWKLNGLKLDVPASHALFAVGVNEAIDLLATALEAVVLAAVAVPIHRSILRGEKGRHGRHAVAGADTALHGMAGRPATGFDALMSISRVRRSNAGPGNRP